RESLGNKRWDQNRPTPPAAPTLGLGQGLRERSLTPSLASSPHYPDCLLSAQSATGGCPRASQRAPPSPLLSPALEGGAVLRLDQSAAAFGPLPRSQPEIVPGFHASMFHQTLFRPYVLTLF